MLKSVEKFLLYFIVFTTEFRSACAVALYLLLKILQTHQQYYRRRLRILVVWPVRACKRDDTSTCLMNIHDTGFFGELDKKKDNRYAVAMGNTHKKGRIS